MKRGFGIAFALAGCLVVAPGLRAQTGAGNGADGAGQSKADKAAKNAKKPAQQPSTPQPAPQAANPFPEDLSTVPVMPSKPADLAPDTFSESYSAASSLPGDDVDPVRSPDADGASESSEPAQVSSSRESNLDSLLPNPGDEDTGGRKKKRGAIVEAPKETAQGDISVGKYYLDQKNWRAAQSRFQSALVLAPEDPEVYWGLAESARHLGNFADASANYEKVMEYDPDSKHAKEAKKALEDPQIENAKAAPAADGASPQ
jgi:tetratricopeptide (TPR) repeat protein